MIPDEAEAHEVLARQVARVEAMPYEEWRAMLPEPRWSITVKWLTISRGEDRMIHEEVVAPSGETYQVAIEPMWDDEEAGMIRVFVAVDGGPISATKPLAESVLVSRPDTAG